MGIIFIRRSSRGGYFTRSNSIAPDTYDAAYSEGGKTLFILRGLRSQLGCPPYPEIYKAAKERDFAWTEIRERTGNGYKKTIENKDGKPHRLDFQVECV